MPASKQATTAKPTRAARPARGAHALDGLEISLDDAQKAITELRGDLSTGGRRLVKDVETAVKNARRDLARTRKAIQSDLGDLGGALTPSRAGSKPAKKPAKKPAAKPAKKPAAKPAKKPAAKAAPRAAGSARSS